MSPKFVQETRAFGVELGLTQGAGSWWLSSLILKYLLITRSRRHTLVSKPVKQRSCPVSGSLHHLSKAGY